MNKKKFASVGIFIAAIAIGAGIAYYVDPTAINNIIGINAAQVDTISDGDLLAVDSGASSSLAAIDPDAGADATAQAVSLSPSSAKKSAQAQKKAGAARSRRNGGGGASRHIARICRRRFVAFAKYKQRRG